MKVRIHDEYVRKLEEIGKKLHFNISKRTPLGIADCIWELQVPHVGNLPIVAFEVVCSEEQKLLKGSLTNLLSIRPSLAVFVLVREEIKKHPINKNTEPEEWLRRIENFIDKLKKSFEGILRIEKWYEEKVDEIYSQIKN
jgi:hypothetical protein